MITTLSIQQLWERKKPAILCYPTMMLPATFAADALSWKTGIEVVVCVSQEMPPGNKLHVFDPAKVLGNVIYELAAVVEEYREQHPTQGLRLDAPGDAEDSEQ